eukprot:GHVU01131094.1.p1 GENE.GHVU01131094.1~~GHVU01131094.1.p1  ORF type:complete len:498 (-),score=45.34 GHVU01131094.1:985-2265(-)
MEYERFSDGEEGLPAVTELMYDRAREHINALVDPPENLGNRLMEVLDPHPNEFRVTLLQGDGPARVPPMEVELRPGAELIKQRARRYGLHLEKVVGEYLGNGVTLGHLYENPNAKVASCPRIVQKPEPPPEPMEAAEEPLPEEDSGILGRLSFREAVPISWEPDQAMTMGEMNGEKGTEQYPDFPETEPPVSNDLLGESDLELHEHEGVQRLDWTREEEAEEYLPFPRPAVTGAYGQLHARDRHPGDLGFDPVGCPVLSIPAVTFRCSNNGSNSYRNFERKSRGNQQFNRMSGGETARPQQGLADREEEEIMKELGGASRIRPPLGTIIMGWVEVEETDHIRAPIWPQRSLEGVHMVRVQYEGGEHDPVYQDSITYFSQEQQRQQERRRRLIVVVAPIHPPGGALVGRRTTRRIRGGREKEVQGRK